MHGGTVSTSLSDISTPDVLGMGVVDIFKAKRGRQHKLNSRGPLFLLVFKTLPIPSNFASPTAMGSYHDDDVVAASSQQNRLLQTDAVA